MPTFLQSPRDVVPEAQQLALRSLTTRFGNQASRGRVTYQSLDHYLRILQEELEAVGGRPFFRARDHQAAPLAKISSETWNQAQERIYVDLRALYAALGEGTTKDAYQGQVNRERFLQIRAQILKIINDLKVYQFLKAEPEYQDAKFINFHLVKNESDSGIRAVVDPRVRLLELAPRARQIQSRARFGHLSTRVEIEPLGGGRPSGMTKEFGPEKMLDSREDTFWAQMILADGPIFQTYYPSGDAGLGGRHDSSGALCHVYLHFDHVRVANNLQLLPFGEFPLRVVDMAYKETTGQTDWAKLPGFEVEDPTLDWIEVNFPPTTIASLRLTVEQVNYHSNLYHLPESMVKNAVLWQHIGALRQEDVLHELDLTQEQKDAITIEPQLVAELEAIEEFKALLGEKPLQQGRERAYKVASDLYRSSIEALTQVRPRLSDDLLVAIDGEGTEPGAGTVVVRTYEYIYGIREVQLRYNRYQPLGTYQSPTYRTKASILEASLTTEERHIGFNDGHGDFQRTSTEWTLDFGRDRKYPIVPRNWRVGGALVVPDEYLYVDRVTRQAVTRFPMADEAVILRENGERVPLSDFTLSTQSPTTYTGPYLATGPTIRPSFSKPSDPPPMARGHGLVTIAASRFDPNAIYTLRYVARDDADTLSLDDELDSIDLDEPEVFEKTARDNGVVLKTFPYVDYAIIHSSKWVKDPEQQTWTFNPTLPNTKTGTISISGSTVTGSGTAWLTELDSDEPNCLRVDGESEVYRVQVVSNTELTLLDPHPGGVSGSAYVAGQYFSSDGRLYGLQRSTYTPIEVLVNGVRAKNFTNYTSREHTAFVEVTGQSKKYEYIHSGNRIYFSRPIGNARIEVYYAWLTEHVRVNGLLRCNVPANTVLTPTVGSLRVELVTSPL